MPETLSLGTYAPRVLVVAADENTREELRRVLEVGGFDVSLAVDGVSGVEAALARRPDLVLVDAALPDIDGFEVATRLRSRGLGASIVALTDRGPHDRGLSVTAGADGSVEKPFDPERLPGQLREFLAGRRDHVARQDERRLLREYAEGLVEKLEAKVKELTRKNEQLLSIDRSKTEFMRSVSHELSTPLTPIVGYLKILKSKRLGELNDKQERVVDAMLQSAERLSRVLDNLSDFSSLESGVYPIRRAPFVPGEAVRALVEEIRPAASARRVGLHLSDRSSGRPLVGDELKLRQALGNLLDNALKFSPPGAQVLVELVGDAEGLTVSVFDQGPGVPAALRERVFEPFVRSEAAAPGRTPGAGLGLPVARRIVAAHGGRIWLESPPRLQPATTDHEYQGTRVAIFLPWEAGTA
jgi:signal transduction histidine kinase